MSQMLIVKRVLGNMVNETETLLDFIRDTEREFGLEQAQVEHMPLLRLETYVDFLNELWNK
jgi:hypothetical protein